ncbi:hypothetical protein MF672_039495 [Actinomadura sp. ATCC 31491]|uniref:Secreted protein n=1 Tax=Actinomadura luzonensis TaxID=2805427 RepID=A0ABT0G6K8_9ACTN|nr:hypothetical protein [Actinomadura luzonensis]MCK2219840.1 hypothetical protein [Actinomadura luzonensis]
MQGMSFVLARWAGALAVAAGVVAGPAGSARAADGWQSWGAWTWDADPITHQRFACRNYVDATVAKGRRLLISGSFTCTKGLGGALSVTANVSGGIRTRYCRAIDLSDRTCYLSFYIPLQAKSRSWVVVAVSHIGGATEPRAARIAFQR